MRDPKIQDLIQFLITSRCLIEGKIWELDLRNSTPRMSKSIFITTFKNEIEFFDALTPILGELHTNMLVCDVRQGNAYLIFLPSTTEDAKESSYNRK